MVAHDVLGVPEEPAELRRKVRQLLEDRPSEGERFVEEGDFLADYLWRHWGARLGAVGMDRERFGRIVRGYAPEVRLWVFGEHVWEHCASGLAGRVLRRIPPEARSSLKRTEAEEVCR
ncbi:MAG: hypothetical protein IRY88_17290 [Rubrobacteraceae bacterium]|nr:hypothetical protein [Rubrobacteraceae bacterium]